MTTLFFVFLSGIIKRQHKAGLVGAMIDAIALTGKCTLGPNNVNDFLVLHSGLDATLQSFVFTRNLTWLGTRCKFRFEHALQASGVLTPTALGAQSGRVLC